MQQPFIKQIGDKYYCTLCGNEAVEDWPDHGYRLDFICRCEDALAWPEREAKRRQVADKIRRLELVEELRQIDKKLGLEPTYGDGGCSCGDTKNFEVTSLGCVIIGADE